MSELASEIQIALSKVGFSNEQIGELSGESRLVQDLGIWGDDFDEFHDLLCELYKCERRIDSKHCPDEFSWMRQPILWIPFLDRKKYLDCEPLTLREIDHIMRE